MNRYEADVVRDAIREKRPLLAAWIVWCARPRSKMTLAVTGSAGAMSLLGLAAHRIIF